MANVDKRNGFQLITGGGRQPRRVRRYVDVDNTLILMPGDAYTIQADGNVARATGAVPVNGIMEAVDLPGAGIAEGPQTHDYVPALTALHIIGIEDDDAEFEVTASVALSADDYDTGAEVNVIDAVAGNIPLRQSRQAIGDVGGDQLRLVRFVDRPLNDPYAQFASVVVKLKPASVQ